MEQWRSLVKDYLEYRRELCQLDRSLDARLRRGGMIRVARFGDLAQSFEAVLFDAFGVLNQGDQVMVGAPDRLAALARQGRPWQIVTNNASQSPGQLLARFHRMGFAGIGLDTLVTSGMTIAPYLAGSRWGHAPCYWVGTGDGREAYCPEPRQRLVNDTARWQEAEALLFCSNRDYRQDERCREEVAWLLAEMRVAMLLVNPDLVAPDGQNRWYQVAGYTAARLLERWPVTRIGLGKPYAPIFDLARQRLPDLAAERILMVGDTLGTDILGGVAQGFTTCLVLSGVTGDHDGSLEAQCDLLGIRPDYVVTGIGD